MKNEELVAAMYRGILSREPDEQGIGTWSQRVESQGVESVLSGLVNSSEFRRRYIVDQVRSGGMEFSTWLTNWMVHLNVAAHLHPVRLDMVKNVVPAGAKVLDLGGASQKPQGAFLEMGYPHAKDLTIVDLPLDIRFKSGVDIDSELVHEGTTVRYAYHSMADLSAYPDETFDLVWSGQTYEHISEAEGEALFPQIARVLKPGGHFAMDTPNRTVTRIIVGQDEMIHAEHQYEYRYDEFVQRFSGHGLKLVERRGLLDMPETVRRGHGVLSELGNGSVNFTPETSYCFYLAYRKH